MRRAVSHVEDETGLAECAVGAGEYDEVLRPGVGLVAAGERVVVDLPPDAVNDSLQSLRLGLRDTTTDALVRVWSRYRRVLRRQRVCAWRSDCWAIVWSGLSTWDSPAA